MIIVNGEVRFGAGEIERLKPALEANIAATRAEDGCEHYHYGVDVSDPNLLLISERWSDQAAIDAHMATPHMAALMGAVGQSKVEAMSVRMYRAEFAGTLLGE
jgi:quinol monooxygenase YgiN